MNELLLEQKLKDFMHEDLGEGDKTNDILFPDSEIATGIFVAKEDGIFSGQLILEKGLSLLDQQVDITMWKKDGNWVKKGETIAKVTGSKKALLSGERVVLNLVQRMSGIATVTNLAVSRLENQEVKICDTRKTTPGIRMLEKYAVTCGGGVNHRHGLYDAIMLKENHIAAVGSITKAVEQVRKSIGHMVKVEVEVETEEELKEAIKTDVDVIMLDNMEPDQIRSLLSMIPDSIKTEASGNIGLDQIKIYAETGVDFISLGFITHSAKSLDISFRLSR
ncbi:carboxylating nicotinate-nucleotide diphosphorylase [Gracilibacillus sp. YIM 98692]|uniref:carboxylating nicotinate-nucleotide diphosphorylase n=1 Tax=Gracilibacillus sp. YIM 98692 TaxID=2663532 RepID=UPI0013D47B2A|nr:carboxylating nicotinate-nucleotide diphosphorylase [Gracilibacillus sp. YIM 98692]